MKKEKIIILDETSGKSVRGRHLKNLANRFEIPYFTNSKDMINQLMKKGR